MGDCGEHQSSLLWSVIQIIFRLIIYKHQKFAKGVKNNMSQIFLTVDVFLAYVYCRRKIDPSLLSTCPLPLQPRKSTYSLFWLFFSVKKKAVFTPAVLTHPCQKYKRCFFHKSIREVLLAANKKSSNTCSQAAPDIDMYLLKKYLLIIKSSLCLCHFF